MPTGQNEKTRDEMWDDGQMCDTPAVGEATFSDSTYPRRPNIGHGQSWGGSQREHKLGKENPTGRRGMAFHVRI